MNTKLLLCLSLALAVLACSLPAGATSRNASPAPSVRLTRRDNYCNGDIGPTEYINWQHIQNGYDILTGNPYVS